MNSVRDNMRFILLFAFILIFKSGFTQFELIKIEQVTGGKQSFLTTLIVSDSVSFFESFKEKSIENPISILICNFDAFNKVNNLLLKKKQDTTLNINGDSSTWGGFKISSYNKDGQLNYYYYVCCNELSIAFFRSMMMQTKEMKLDISKSFEYYYLGLSQEKKK